jgi:hypothetical protein
MRPGRHGDDHAMIFDEILDFVVERTKHKRYRDLVAESYPDRDFWRQHVIDRYEELVSQPSSKYKEPAQVVGVTSEQAPCCGGVPLPP